VPGLVQNFSHRLKGAWRRIVGAGFDRCTEPIELGGLRANCHEQWPGEPDVIPAWDALLQDVPTATGFHSPVWQEAVYHTLGKPGRLRLILVRDGPRMVGVLPMHVRDDGLLESMAPGVTDYLDPLTLPGREADVWRVALKLLARLRAGRWKNVALHNVRDAATCRAILPDLAHAEGFEFTERIAEHCPAVTLPRTWDDYLATLDPHVRKETRRKLNKATTKGNARVVRCSPDATEIAATLRTAFSLMEQAPGAKGQAVRKTLRPLLERAAPPMIASGRLWLTTLYVNDAPAACTLQFPHPTGPMLYNCGYDDAHREWSPGVVLTAQIIRDAIDAGAATFDLLRGQEPYKYKLGAIDRPLQMITLRKT
jgi:CelD/BcsL family acetyltransferase involved in cellulose biosynthesis